MTPPTKLRVCATILPQNSLAVQKRLAARFSRKTSRNESVEFRTKLAFATSNTKSVNARHVAKIEAEIGRQGAPEENLPGLHIALSRTKVNFFDNGIHYRVRNNDGPRPNHPIQCAPSNNKNRGQPPITAQGIIDLNLALVFQTFSSFVLIP
jgi:hypothetical protein